MHTCVITPDSISYPSSMFLQIIIFRLIDSHTEKERKKLEHNFRRGMGLAGLGSGHERVMKD